MVLHVALLMPILLYVGKTMVWKEEERFGIRALQMDIRSLLSFRRIGAKCMGKRAMGSGERGG